MKILIIRFSSIGDIVLTTPVIRCLKNQSGAEIHFLTKIQYRSIIEHNPYITRCWFIEKNIQGVIPQLKKEKFDAIVDLHKNLRSFALRRKLSCPAYDFDKLNLQKWLMVNWKIDRLPHRHIVHRYMESVRHWNVHYDNKGLDYFIPSDARKKTVDFLNYHQLQEKGYHVFVLGAAHNTKKPHYELIYHCIENSHLPMVLIGGKEEMEQGKKLSAASQNAFDACGQFDINGSAALIDKAQKVITPDTGMMHIAAALDKNIISIWGNTIPEFGMYPFLPSTSNATSVIVENKALKCRPCSKLGSPQCPQKHHDCIKGISYMNLIQLINDK